MKQSYINIFENSGGGITIAYASCVDDQALEIEPVQHIAIAKEDIRVIAQELINLAEFFEEG